MQLRSGELWEIILPLPLYWRLILMAEQIYTLFRPCRLTKCVYCQKHSFFMWAGFKRGGISRHSTALTVSCVLGLTLLPGMLGLTIILNKVNFLLSERRTLEVRSQVSGTTCLKPCPNKSLRPTLSSYPEVTAIGQEDMRWGCCQSERPGCHNYFMLLSRPPRVCRGGVLVSANGSHLE